MRNLNKWIVLSLFLAPVLAAQTKESLLIGPGDQLHVQVFDTPELEEHARVTDGGELPLVLGGAVKVAGLTPEQAANAIENALSQGHFLKNPRVLVTVEQYATQNVSVIGEVKTPGAYPIGTPRSILDVLSLAGGLTELADRKVLIQRHGTTEKIPYFISNASATALDTAVQVNPGDTVLVPRAGIVYVLGDVLHPGGYTMTNNEARISVLELIARAGGTNHSAVPSQTKLIRKSSDGYVETQVPLSRMQKGKQADLQLQADDIVYVPFSYLRNFALNATGVAAEIGAAALYKF
jgi:polysaccharide export outer membrane protein